jgi:hypothetical protein
MLMSYSAHLTPPWGQMRAGCIGQLASLIVLLADRFTDLLTAWRGQYSKIHRGSVFRKRRQGGRMVCAVMRLIGSGFVGFG